MIGPPYFEHKTLDLANHAANSEAIRGSAQFLCRRLFGPTFSAVLAGKACFCISKGEGDATVSFQIERTHELIF
jgi:hypothetical protein